MELIAGVILIVVLAGSILGIIAWNQTGRLSAELESLKRDVARLALASRAPAAPPEEPMPGGVEPAPAPPAPPEPAPAAPAEPREARWAPPPQVPSQSIEEALTSRWLVWGGSVALAFGGFFLVKFSIEQGWLGPDDPRDFGRGAGRSGWSSPANGCAAGPWSGRWRRSSRPTYRQP